MKCCTKFTVFQIHNWSEQHSCKNVFIGSQIAKATVRIMPYNQQQDNQLYLHFIQFTLNYFCCCCRSNEKSDAGKRLIYLCDSMSCWCCCLRRLTVDHRCPIKPHFCFVYLRENAGDQFVSIGNYMS